MVKVEEKAVEIQIRTKLQHRWAELSEKLADVFDPAIKYGGGAKEVQEFLKNSSEQIAEIEAMLLRTTVLRNDVESMQREAPEVFRARFPKLLTEGRESHRAAEGFVDGAMANLDEMMQFVRDIRRE